MAEFVKHMRAIINECRSRFLCYIRNAEGGLSAGKDIKI